MSDERSWQSPGGVPQPGQGQWPGQGQGQQQWAYGSGVPAGPPGSQPGWTPPPKPGLIPLRPLSFGALLGAPFQVLRRNPKATFGSALLIQGVIMLATLVVVGIVTALAIGRIASAEQSDVDAVSAGAVAGILLSALIPIALSLVGAAFLQGIIVLEVARATLGEKLALRALWRSARSRLGTLVLWILILAGILIGVVAVLAGIVTVLVLLGGIGVLLGVIAGVLGLLAVLVLGAWLYTKVSLVPSLIVLEHGAIRASIRRSWSLTNGYFWRTFGVQILIAMIVNLVSQIVVTPVTLVFSFLSTLIDPNDSGSVNGSAVIAAIVAYLVVILISLVIGAITQVVQSAAIALIYIDLRMRKEGLDLDLVRFVEARQAGRTDLPDPYQTGAPTAAGTAPGTAGR